MTLSWMTYEAAHAFEKEAERLGVSETARSKRGFMREYQLAKSAAAMRSRPLPAGVHGGDTWGIKRDNFVKRHMAQYRKNPTYRRFLALIMWAFRPPGGVPHDRSRRSAGRRSGGRRSRRSGGHRRR